MLPVSVTRVPEVPRSDRSGLGCAQRHLQFDCHRTGQAYAGSVTGREIVYERPREQVQADIGRLNPELEWPRR
jgi:hypothetical protein